MKSCKVYLLVILLDCNILTGLGMGIFYNGGVVCDYDEFRCKNGHCIPTEYTCDGMVDCGRFDTSDEQNCHVKDLCDSDPLDYFRCNLTKRCIPKSNVCDGVPDCLYGDWSDENAC